MTELFGHIFKQDSLCEAALRHSSVSGGARGVDSFQRLEFLGDRVVNLGVATMLLEHFPKADEGELSRRYAALVRADFLAGLARETGLDARLSLAINQGAHGGTANVNILADALEAALGAIYLDGGYAAAEAVVRRLWAAGIEAEPVDVRDSKTRLQEWAQSRKLPLPVYETLEHSGPAHAPSFRVRVSVGEAYTAEAEGSNKQQAGKEAAMLLLARLGK